MITPQNTLSFPKDCKSLKSIHITHTPPQTLAPRFSRIQTNCVPLPLFPFLTLQDTVSKLKTTEFVITAWLVWRILGKRRGEERG
jgi:hypothetical protein